MTAAYDLKSLVLINTKGELIKDAISSRVSTNLRIKKCSN
jgi:hypothetical protein